MIASDTRLPSSLDIAEMSSPSDISLLLADPYVCGRVRRLLVTSYDLIVELRALQRS